MNQITGMLGKKADQIGYVGFDENISDSIISLASDPVNVIKYRIQELNENSDIIINKIGEINTIKRELDNIIDDLVRYKDDMLYSLKKLPRNSDIREEMKQKIIKSTTRSRDAEIRFNNL
jgi:DNA repair ATPase RecN